jgi:helix-turn-helix protein
MSRKELPHAGLVQAALAGRITNREGAQALHLTSRQFQRLKQRVRLGGLSALRHQSRGRPSPRRLPATRVRGCKSCCKGHGLRISRESVRRLRRALGWPAVHRRRPPKHRTRPARGGGRPARPARRQPLRVARGSRPRDDLARRDRRRHLRGPRPALPPDGRPPRVCHRPAPGVHHLRFALTAMASASWSAATARGRECARA